MLNLKLKVMRILNFYFRGELYKVNENGCINTNGIGRYSDTWKFRGGTKHHWSRRITVTLTDAFGDPTKLNGCLGFDVDHGTMRQWGGLYQGKLPRITGAWINDK